MALYDGLKEGGLRAFSTAGNAWDSFKQYFSGGPEQSVSPANINYGTKGYEPWANASQADLQAEQAAAPSYNSNAIDNPQQSNYPEWDPKVFNMANTPKPRMSTELNGQTFDEYNKGILEPGNIDLAGRTRFDAGNGKQKTILGTSYNIDGVETLIPTVHPETGEDMEEEEAINLFRKTGKHLGMYASPTDATAASRSMSENQTPVENPQQPIDRFGGAKDLPEEVGALKAANWRNNQGVQQLQTDEGTKRNWQGEHVVYPDTEGYLTAGIGHKLTEAELASGKYGKGIAVPQEQVDKWFKADLETANADVDALYKDIKLDGTSREVLVNMAFNLGRTGLSKFEKMNEGFAAGDMKKVVREMKDSKWWGQVGDRSKRLAKQLETKIA